MLTPEEIPYLLLGFFVSLVFNGREFLRRRLASAVLNLVARLSAVHVEVVLAAVFLLGLSQRPLVLHGVDVHGPKTGGNRGHDRGGSSNGRVRTSDRCERTSRCVGDVGCLDDTSAIE